MALPYVVIFTYFCIASGNAAAILKFRRNPLNSELFKRFIPCLYLNAAQFGILTVFDYHTMAFVLGVDVARYLIAELFTQRFEWREWFKHGYWGAVGAFLAIMLIRHFWFSQGSCYKATDIDLFVDICIFFEVVGFIGTLISLIVLKLGDEQKTYRFLLLIATVIEMPECFIEVVFDQWHPIHSPSFMYFRMLAYGLLQVVFVVVFIQVGRKIKDQSKDGEMETAFANPAGEDVYL